MIQTHHAIQICKYTNTHTHIYIYIYVCTCTYMYIYIHGSIINWNHLGLQRRSIHPAAMDLCDRWTHPSDNEEEVHQEEIQPADPHGGSSTEDEWPDPEEELPDPWQLLGPAQDPPARPMEALQEPEEETLAMAWGDLQSTHNDWPVAIAPHEERNQMEVEDVYSMAQREVDHEEEQTTWYETIASIASNLTIDCKTEPPSSPPSEEDPALQFHQDQEEYEDVVEETKQAVPEPAAPPRPATTTPPWRTIEWQNYWQHYPVPGTSSSSSYSRPGPYHGEASRAAPAPAYGPSRDQARDRNQFVTGWKAKVCYFVSAWNHQDFTRCDHLLAEFLGSPPQDHQLTQPGDKGGANWATKAKWLMEAYQSQDHGKVTRLANWHFDHICLFTISYCS